MIWSLNGLLYCAQHSQKEMDGDWLPARPVYLTFLGVVWLHPFRIKAAWGVLTGRYDAVEWPGGQ